MNDEELQKQIEELQGELKASSRSITYLWAILWSLKRSFEADDTGALARFALSNVTPGILEQ